MQSLSLRSLVQLDLAAFALVLLTFPCSFLFNFPRDRHASVGLGLAYTALLFAPAILGYALDWYLQRRIHLGLLHDCWSPAQVENAARLVAKPMQYAFLAISLLVLAGFAIFTSPRHNAHSLVVYVLISLGPRFSSLRLKLMPPTAKQTEGLWTHLAPLHSEHWGKR